MVSNWMRRLRHCRIRCVLFLLIITTILPLLGMHLWLTYSTYQHRCARELSTNLETARVLATAFDSFQRTVLNQEAVLGAVIAQDTRLPHAELNDLLRQSTATMPAIRYYNWVNLHGIIVASSEPRAIGLNISDRAHFRTIIAGRDWFISDLFETRATGAGTFAISRSVRDAHGRLLGVLVAIMNPHNLGNMLSLGKFEQYTFAVCDSRGRIAYRYTQPTTVVPRLNRGTVNVDQSGIYPAPDGHGRQFVARVPVGGTGWSVAAVRALEQVMQPMRYAVLRDIAITAIIVLGVVIIALLLARTIEVPLRELREHAQRLEQGDFAQRVTIDASSDLIDLGNAFNGMAAANAKHQGDRERLLEIAERQRAFLAVAMELLPVQVVFIDAETKATIPNAAMSRWIKEQQIQHWRQLLLRDPETRRRIPYDDWPIQRALRGETCLERPFLLCTPQGVELPVTVYAAPVILNGEIVAAIAALHDLSQLKADDRAKDDFLAILAHELLTPVTSMLGWAQIAQDEANPPATVQALVTIERNARRQKHLVDDLLDLARILRDRMQLTTAQSDLWQLAEQTADDLRYLLADQHLALRCEPPVCPLPILGDTDRLQQVISNLLTNAYKCTPANGVITVSGQREGDCAVVTITDTGSGLTTEQLADLFMPFHTHRYRQFGGLGLGLAVARGIIELHGGQITATSPGSGQGSTFTISLPLRDTTAASTPSGVLVG